MNAGCLLIGVRAFQVSDNVAPIFNLSVYCKASILLLCSYFPALSYLQSLTLVFLYNLVRFQAPLLLIHPDAR